MNELVNSFADGAAIYREFDKAKGMVGASAATFEEYFQQNLSALLTWQVPNGYTIKYHGKQLKNHSLGQRASALILFVLSQRDNDVVIIDQPEDDLDNQTIYEDVIKLVRKLKPKTQFIFATHNPNIPVLGDAEQIIACALHERFDRHNGRKHRLAGPYRKRLSASWRAEARHSSDERRFTRYGNDRTPRNRRARRGQPASVQGGCHQCNSLASEIVAFANGSGGQIFIGVADDGTVQPHDVASVVR